MMPTERKRPARYCLRLVLLLLVVARWGFPAQTQNTAARWEKNIQAFEKRDKAAPPAEGGILFLGSSSIRMWPLDDYFPHLPVINRGFGGSQVSDSIAFLDRIVLPCKPRIILFYAGDNDIAAGKSPETVRDDFDTFTGRVHDALPDTRIIFIAIKPSISRWRLVGKMRKANRLIQERIQQDKRLSYADIDTPMIGPDGMPRPDLFLGDGLHLNAKGYTIWSDLVRPMLRHPFPAGQCLVATCQFPVSADLAANARWIEKQMAQAHRLGAHAAHFPECALSGYAGVDHASLAGFDWDAQRAALARIASMAKDLSLWVILGAAHPLGAGHKPHNALYIIDPAGNLVDRYDKRFCTAGDLKHYSPGDHFTTCRINGVQCGFLICYDIRFPELFRQYHLMDVQLIFHSFYNARQKPGAIHPRIMPPTVQARAASNYCFMSVSNACAPASWESLFATPDGLIARRLTRDTPGVMVNRVDTTRGYYDASRPYRKDCIKGKLNSGKTVKHPRSENRADF